MPASPNVLLLWTDQHQRDALGTCGNEQIETPALDELASGGTVFENAYCTSPVCTPSRSAVMTGQYPHANGAVDNGWALPRSVQCFSEHPVFEEYATGYVGKWDLGDELFPQHGFDEWISIEDLYSFGHSEGRSMARYRGWGGSDTTTTDIDRIRE